MADREPSTHRRPTRDETAPQTRRLSLLRTYLSDADAQRFDRLVSERIRLGMLSALAVNETLTFTQLRNLLDTTDGNLSVHARKLEDADYVVCTKSFEGRTPRTEYRLSTAGRRALERYLSHMEALIEATRRDP